MKIGRICVLICGIQLFVGINNLFGCLKPGIRCHTSHRLISVSSIYLEAKHILPELVKEVNPAELEAQNISLEQTKNQKNQNQSNLGSFYSAKLRKGDQVSSLEPQAKKYNRTKLCEGDQTPISMIGHKPQVRNMWLDKLQAQAF